jgi:hypothetical protein
MASKGSSYQSCGTNEGKIRMNRVLSMGACAFVLVACGGSVGGIEQDEYRRSNTAGAGGTIGIAGMGGGAGEAGAAGVADIACYECPEIPDNTEAVFVIDSDGRTLRLESNSIIYSAKAGGVCWKLISSGNFPPVIRSILEYEGPAC